MIMAYDFLALGAAACWAIGSMTSVMPSRHLGAFAYTRWRMIVVALMLWGAVYVYSGWHPIQYVHIQAMAISGLVGIFIGDTALFAAMNRLGPRKAGVLFATHAVFSVILGIILLKEQINLSIFIGMLLTCAGVMIAILAGRKIEQKHSWEQHNGSLKMGAALGITAALCQSLGTFFSKPAMQSGIDPLTANAIRVSVAAAAHILLHLTQHPITKTLNPMTPKAMGLTIFNGFIGMGVGMTLILLALKHGNIGIVSVLSAVTPIIVLPLLWIYMKQRPTIGAWIGASFTVIGTAIILLRPH